MKSIIGRCLGACLLAWLGSALHAEERPIHAVEIQLLAPQAEGELANRASMQVRFATDAPAGLELAASITLREPSGGTLVAHPRQGDDGLFRAEMTGIDQAGSHGLSIQVEGLREGILYQGSQQQNVVFKDSAQIRRAVAPETWRCVLEGVPDEDAPRYVGLEQTINCTFSALPEGLTAYPEELLVTLENRLDGLEATRYLSIRLPRQETPGVYQTNVSLPGNGQWQMRWQAFPTEAPTLHLGGQSPRLYLPRAMSAPQALAWPATSLGQYECFSARIAGASDAPRLFSVPAGVTEADLVFNAACQPGATSPDGADFSLRLSTHPHWPAGEKVTLGFHQGNDLLKLPFIWQPIRPTARQNLLAIHEALGDTVTEWLDRAANLAVAKVDPLAAALGLETRAEAVNWTGLWGRCAPQAMVSSSTAPWSLHALGLHPQALAMEALIAESQAYRPMWQMQQQQRLDALLRESQGRLGSLLAANGALRYTLWEQSERLRDAVQRQLFREDFPLDPAPLRRRLATLRIAFAVEMAAWFHGLDQDWPENPRSPFIVDALAEVFQRHDPQPALDCLDAVRAASEDLAPASQFPVAGKYLLDSLFLTHRLLDYLAQLQTLTTAVETLATGDSTPLIAEGALQVNPLPVGAVAQVAGDDTLVAIPFNLTNSAAQAVEVALDHAYFTALASPPVANVDFVRPALAMPFETGLHRLVATRWLYDPTRQAYRRAVAIPAGETRKVWVPVAGSRAPGALQRVRLLPEFSVMTQFVARVGEGPWLDAGTPVATRIQLDQTAPCGDCPLAQTSSRRASTSSLLPGISLDSQAVGNELIHSVENRNGGSVAVTLSQSLAGAGTWVLPEGALQRGSQAELQRSLGGGQRREIRFRAPRLTASLEIPPAQLTVAGETLTTPTMTLVPDSGLDWRLRETQPGTILLSIDNRLNQTQDLVVETLAHGEDAPLVTTPISVPAEDSREISLALPDRVGLRIRLWNVDQTRVLGQQWLLPPDHDQDGLPDAWAHAGQTTLPDPLADYDGDGLTNQQEVELGTDPWDIDSDDDGLRDLEESLRGGTSPVVTDSDGGGEADGAEVYAGLDPLFPDDDRVGGEIRAPQWIAAGQPLLTSWRVSGFSGARFQVALQPAGVTEVTWEDAADRHFHRFPAARLPDTGEFTLRLRAVDNNGQVLGEFSRVARVTLQRLPASHALAADALDLTRESGPDLLAAVNRALQAYNLQLSQDAASGVVSAVDAEGSRFDLLPRAIAAHAGEPGVVLEDTLRVQTDAGVALELWPATPADLQPALQAIGLPTATLAADGTLRLPVDETVGFLARPDWMATTAEGAVPILNTPGGLASLRFQSTDQIRELSLLPAPLGFEQLRLLPGVSRVEILGQGMIWVTLADHTAVKLLPDYALASDQDSLLGSFTPVADQNGDGLADYLARYPNHQGQQIFWQLP